MRDIIAVIEYLDIKISSLIKSIEKLDIEIEELNNDNSSGFYSKFETKWNLRNDFKMQLISYESIKKFILGDKQNEI
jgi:FtsZ-binding cell division protein ZapB